MYVAFAVHGDFEMEPGAAADLPETCPMRCSRGKPSSSCRVLVLVEHGRVALGLAARQRKQFARLLTVEVKAIRARPGVHAGDLDAEALQENSDLAQPLLDEQHLMHVIEVADRHVIQRRGRHCECVWGHHRSRWTAAMCEGSAARRGNLVDLRAHDL